MTEKNISIDRKMFNTQPDIRGITCVDEYPPNSFCLDAIHFIIGAAIATSLRRTYVKRAYDVISMSLLRGA